MHGAAEVVEHRPPGGILGGAAAVAFVDDDEVEEIRAELAVDVPFFLGAGDGLVEREVDLVGLVDRAVLDLGHRAGEGLEVVALGLVDEDVAVGEEEDAAVGVRLPEAPDDLEGGVGLAGAGRHDEQDAVLPLGDGLDGAVDRRRLVVARLLAGVVVVLRVDRRDIGADAFPGQVALPECFGRREFAQRDLGFEGAIGAGPVVEDEAVAVAGEGEGHVEHRGVVERLLDAVAHRVIVVLGLDDGQRQAGLVVEDVVRAADAVLVTPAGLPAHHDAAVGEPHFLAHLQLGVPLRRSDRRRDVLGADVAFGQRLLVHEPGVV